VSSQPNVLWLVENPYRTQLAHLPLRGEREESWRVALLGLDNSPAGDLDGVASAKLSWKRDGVQGTGSLSWEGETPPDWLHVRVQPWYRADFPDGSFAEWPLGVYIPATPDSEWDDGVLSQDVDLYDKLMLLVESETDDVYDVPAGAVVTDTVRTILAEVGIPSSEIAITDSPKTTATAFTWDAGTSRLEMVNALLTSITYSNLSADGYGLFVSAPFVPQKERTPVWDFRADRDGIYDPKFKHLRDTFKVPNRVICISRGEGGWEGLRSELSNTDPSSPFSIPSRGYTITVTFRDVDASTQADLDAYCAKKLVEVQQVASTISINHWMIPLRVDDVVTFANDDAGLALNAVVEQTEVTLDTDGFADASSTIREII
jgi:hypothetical protein